jgi:hypothetical protein
MQIGMNVQIKAASSDSTLEPRDSTLDTDLEMSHYRSARRAHRLSVVFLTCMLALSLGMPIALYMGSRA